MVSIFYSNGIKIKAVWLLSLTGFHVGVGVSRALGSADEGMDAAGGRLLISKELCAWIWFEFQLVDKVNALVGAPHCVVSGCLFGSWVHAGHKIARQSLTG